MKVRGLKTVRQAARWLAGRWGRPVLILGYHRLVETDHDSYQMAVRPAHFAEQMAVLRQEAYPLSLRQLEAGLQTGKLPRRAVVVTFDDGYADVLREARPVLAACDIPATAFIVAGSFGQPFWWDELAWLVREPAALYDQSLAHPERRHAILSELRAASPQNGAADGRALTPAEVAELASDGLVEIGSHTMTHPLLATLPAAAQEAELRQSKVDLEAIVGRPVTAFSYPHGSATAVTQTLVRTAGYHLACASHNGLARRGSNPFFLPRFWPPDWDGDRFGRWLRRWLA